MVLRSVNSGACRRSGGKTTGTDCASLDRTLRSVGPGLFARELLLDSLYIIQQHAFKCVVILCFIRSCSGEGIGMFGLLSRWDQNGPLGNTWPR